MALDDLLAKISSYNIFNYLLPGVLFVVLSQVTTAYKFDQPNLLLAAFIYYFIGMVVSRIGSLIVEPLLKWARFLKFADYGDFVRVSGKDAKLETLSEANNTYRTLCSLFLCLGFVWAYEKFVKWLPGVGPWTLYLTVGLLFFVFLFSYRKQSNYISKRVAAQKHK